MSIPAENGSVVLRYDEKTDKLWVFSLPSTKVLELKTGGDGFEIPLSDFRALPHDEVEGRVGAALLQLLDSFSGFKLGLRDYVQEFEADLELMIAEAEKEAESGNADALHNLATLYGEMALRRKSPELLGKARTVEAQAAAKGHTQATLQIEMWSAFEKRLERRIHEG